MNREGKAEGALPGRFGWREVTITNDLEQLRWVLDRLEGAGIPCRVRQRNTGHTNRGGGLLGSLGEAPGRSVLYQVRVPKGELERARWCLATR